MVDSDLGIKTLYLNMRRAREKEDLRKELLREAEMYKRYVDLQSQVIPHFFGLRTMQIVDCFITDYIGPPFETFENLTKEQCQMLWLVYLLFTKEE